jgi:hypothetical protein
MSDMRRRDFITVVGGAAVAWPVAARAQQPGKLPVVGYLGPESPAVFASRVRAFRQGLGETGYAEGRNVAIEPDPKPSTDPHRTGLMRVRTESLGSADGY